MGIRDIVIAGAASGLTALGLLIGISGSDGGSKSPHPASPTGISIEEICRKTETTIRLVQTENGPQFQAKYDTQDIRYDLTWQPSGTVVAVEQLSGGFFVPSVQQLTPEFQKCVDDKGYQIVPRGQ